MTGCLVGSCNPRKDILRLIGLWESDQLHFKGRVTSQHAIGEINEAVHDLQAGHRARGAFTR